MGIFARKVSPARKYSVADCFVLDLAKIHQAVVVTGDLEFKKFLKSGRLLGIMITLDTSALTRFFTKDNASRANQVQKLLESEEEIFIPGVVFVELGFVLAKLYKTSRTDLAEAFNFLLSRKNIKTSVNTREAVGNTIQSSFIGQNPKEVG